MGFFIALKCRLNIDVFFGHCSNKNGSALMIKACIFEVQYPTTEKSNLKSCIRKQQQHPYLETHLKRKDFKKINPTVQWDFCFATEIFSHECTNQHECSLLNRYSKVNGAIRLSLMINLPLQLHSCSAAGHQKSHSKKQSYFFFFVCCPKNGRLK